MCKICSSNTDSSEATLRQLGFIIAQSEAVKMMNRPQSEEAPSPAALHCSTAADGCGDLQHLNCSQSGDCCWQTQATQRRYLNISTIYCSMHYAGTTATDQNCSMCVSRSRLWLGSVLQCCCWRSWLQRVLHLQCFSVTSRSHNNIVLFCTEHRDVMSELWAESSSWMVGEMRPSVPPTPSPVLWLTKPQLTALV